VIFFLARDGYLSENDLVQLLLVSKTWRDVIDRISFAKKSVLFSSVRCKLHAIPRRSERPERIQVILDRCLRRFPRIKCIQDLPYATPLQLGRFHTEVHVDTIIRLGKRIEKSMEQLDKLVISISSATTEELSSGHLKKRKHLEQFKYIDIDDDTVMMRHTLDASMLAAGAVCRAIDHVMEGNTTNAFCVVRPPGHHAEPQRAMGFCFFNNVGVGAFHAIDRYGLDRVLILDFDVHHGNGTQKRIEKEPKIMYISLHQAPFYPGTGHSHEEGAYNNIVNIPLRARTNSRMYRKVFLEKVVNRIEAFLPQFILLSAGFDAHEKDPLADIRLRTEDYYWLTSQIVELAWKFCHGRVVSVLEGGYHLRALADSTEQHLMALVHGSLNTQAL
jgi:acetoin utilization deacetylase AcuC-like enzyme